MPTDMISRSIATAAYARTGDPNPIRLTSMLGGTILADETAGLANAVAQMNSQRRPLLIDRSINITGWSTISGYCVISCAEDALINFTGSANGFRARNSSTAVGSWNAAPALAQWPATTGSFVTALTVGTATYATLEAGDHVYLSDSVPNTFSYFNGESTTNYTNLAEIAMVLAKAGGNTIYLDRVLGEWKLYSAAGTVSRLGDNPCVLNLNIKGEQNTTRDLVRVEGYVGPDIDVRIDSNSSRGLMLLSCMGGRVRAKVRDLRDDETNNSFGYGVCAAAATTDCKIEVHARNVRHAYSDIIVGTANGLTPPLTLSGGVARRIAVTGEGISCSAATWDTHTHSDQVRFENIKAHCTHNADPGQPTSGLNCAVQVRGTNVTIDGLETNLQVGIRYGVASNRNSRMEVYNFRHHNTLVGSPNSTNALASFIGTTFSGSGTHKVNIRNSSLHNTIYSGAGWNFVAFHNSEIDMSTSSSGWPGNVAGNIGCLTEYVDCTVREPGSMNISTGLVFDGGKIIKANTNGFNLLDGANLKARNHGIEITGGGSIANAAYAYSTITSGAASFSYSGLWVDDARAEHSVKPFAYGGAGGTQTLTIKSLSAPGQYKGVSSRGNLDITLRPGRDRQFQRFSGTFTADVTVSMELIDVDDGDWFEIFRPGGGAFNLLVKQGSTTLVTLAANQSCRVVYDGTNGNWRVTNKGVLA